jgi:hypothetical protein
MLQNGLPSISSKNLLLGQSFSLWALLSERASKETDSFFWFRGTIPFFSVSYPRFLKILDLTDG